MKDTFEMKAYTKETLDYIGDLIFQIYLDGYGEGHSEANKDVIRQEKNMKNLAEHIDKLKELGIDMSLYIKR